MSSESVEIATDEVVVDRSALAALTQRMDRLETENQRQAEDIERLSEELKDTKTHAAKDRAAIRRQLSDEIEDVNEGIRDEQQQRGKTDAKIARRVSICEDELDIDGGVAVATGEGGEEAAHLTTLARFKRYGPEALSGGKPTVAEQRAHVILQNFEDWGTNTSDAHGGKVTLCSKKDNLKELLEAKVENRLQWNQVYRAMERLEEIAYETRLNLREGTNAEGSHVLELPYENNRESLLSRGIE